MANENVKLPNTYADLGSPMVQAETLPNYGKKIDDHLINDKTQATKFRAAGGTVVAHYYGDWTRQSVSWNASPWRVFRNYPERIPYRAVTYVDVPKFVFPRGNTGFISTSSSIVSGAGKISQTAATGTNPTLTTPILPYLDGNQWTSIEIDIVRTGGTTGWAGNIYFATWEDATLNAAKKFTMTQPTWSGATVQTIVVSTTGNTYWATGTIKQLRFDFGGAVGDSFDISRIEIKGNLKQSRQLEVRGMFSEDQAFADYEIREAYKAGIDVFLHCFYWTYADNETTRKNLAQASLDAHVASTAVPDMKFALNWADTAQNFTTTADVNTLFDKIISYFSNPRYWTINGQPVVSLYNLSIVGQIGQTIYGASDNTKNGVKAFINAFNARYGSTIHFNILGATDHPYWNSNSLGYVGGFDYAGVSSVGRYYIKSAYTDIAPAGGGGTATATYPTASTVPVFAALRSAIAKYVGNMVSATFSNGSHYTNTVKSWYPIICGRDGNAWIDKDTLPTAFDSTDIAPPSKAEFSAMLVDARNLILSSPASLAPVVTIYAWNEFGEGGILCPTPQNNGRYLEAINDVFGR